MFPAAANTHRNFLALESRDVRSDAQGVLQAALRKDRLLRDGHAYRVNPAYAGGPPATGGAANSRLQLAPGHLALGAGIKLPPETEDDRDGDGDGDVDGDGDEDEDDDGGAAAAARNMLVDDDSVAFSHRVYRDAAAAAAAAAAKAVVDEDLMEGVVVRNGLPDAPAAALE